LLVATGRAGERLPSSGALEGARLITGRESAPIEDSAFLVEDQTITRVGKRGTLQAPAGVVRVDLSGKTVMPAMVDLHGIGHQNTPAGTM